MERVWFDGQCRIPTSQFRVWVWPLWDLPTLTGHARRLRGVGRGLLYRVGLHTDPRTKIGAQSIDRGTRVRVSVEGWSADEPERDSRATHVRSCDWPRASSPEVLALHGIPRARDVTR